jgi:hypothetical protein
MCLHRSLHAACASVNLLAERTFRLCDILILPIIFPDVDDCFLQFFFVHAQDIEPGCEEL